MVDRTIYLIPFVVYPFGREKGMEEVDFRMLQQLLLLLVQDCEGTPSGMKYFKITHRTVTWQFLG